MPYLAADDRYDSMIYNRVGRSGLKLPAISLGWWYNFGGVDPLENGRAIARRAFDLGVTHFDLANNYGPPPGSAEENFGRLFRQDFHPYRDELIISTKAGYDMWPGPYGEWGSRKYLLASLDGSLRRMGLDYVDIFYSHRPDPDTPLEETMGALDSAVRQGKAHFGGSLVETINRATRAGANVFVDASRLAEALFASHLPANIFLLGVAYQAGYVPLSAAAIEGVEWLGPATPRIARMQGLHRRHLLVKAETPSGVRAALAVLRAPPGPGRGVEEQHDVDPVGMA